MPNPYVMLLECIVIFSLITHSVQVRFHLHPNGQKCLRENIHKDVLVSGDYDVQQTPGQNVEIQVTDSSGQILYSKTEVAAGKFLFNTEHNDAYEICFLSKVTPTVRGMKQEVSITTKHGVEAKSYEGYILGEAAKLKPMEVELKRLEDLSESIVQDFSFMREREQQMRDTNESTNSRVLYFSLFSLGCLVSLATWQVLYLRKFFKAKKLIE